MQEEMLDKNVNMKLLMQEMQTLTILYKEITSM